MGPAMGAFKGHRIHLVSQAASDLNFTVVVGEEGADRLVRDLHDLLIPKAADPELFGPSWEELAKRRD
jgi:diaminopimelate decarboxylase/aspartate kinase